MRTSALFLVGILTLCYTFCLSQTLTVSGGTTTLTGKLGYQWIDVLSGGTLVLADGADVTLTSRISGTDYSLRVQEGGTISFGTSRTPIDRLDVVRLTLTDSSRMLIQGEMYAYGPTATEVIPFTRLSADASAGSTTIEVDDVTGWRIGGEIAIATTSNGGWECESRTITNITNNTVTLNDPLWWLHQGTDTVTISARDSSGAVKYTKQIDTRAHVAYLTRPIEIRAPGEALDTYGADIMIMGNGRAPVFTGVELSRLGQASPSTLTYTAGSVTTDSYSGKVRPGRYALHYHFGGAAKQDTIRNCVSNRGRHKFIVVHQTGGVYVEDNVSWQGWSHQFVGGEDGVDSERDIVFNRNLVMYNRRPVNSDNASSNDFGFQNTRGYLSNHKIEGLSNQLEIHPGSFMLWTPDCTVTNNVVAGGVGVIGYYYDFYLGRSQALTVPADVAALPSDFVYADEIDSVLDDATLVFNNNFAYGLSPEESGKYGTGGDVTQGIGQATTNASLSYRTSGLAFWMDEGADWQIEEQIELVFKNLYSWNNAGIGWNEYPWSVIDSVYGFHNRFGWQVGGGVYRENHFIQDNLLGQDHTQDLRYQQAVTAGVIAGTEDHYEGYLDGTSNLARDYEGLAYPAFFSYNKDQNGGAKPQRFPASITDCSVEGYPIGLIVAQNFEGPYYVNDFWAEGATSRLIVDYDTDMFNDQAPGDPGLYSYDGCFGGCADLTTSGSNGQGSFDGILFDIDNMTALHADGSSGGDCTDWVVLRSDTRDGVITGFIENANGAASSEPWYTTHSAVRPYTSSARSDDGLQSATAILANGASISAPPGALVGTLKAYGCVDGVSATVGGTPITYTASSAPEGFDVRQFNIVAPLPGFLFQIQANWQLIE